MYLNWKNPILLIFSITFQLFDSHFILKNYSHVWIRHSDEPIFESTCYLAVTWREKRRRNWHLLPCLPTRTWDIRTLGMQFAFQKQKKCQYQITVFDIMKYYQSGRIFKANFKTVKKTMRINYQIQQIYKLPLNSELKNSHIHLQIWNFKNLIWHFFNYI